MSLVLTKSVDNISSPLVIVCEGMGDVHLVKCLLRHNNIENCQVGCPSTDSVQGMGKDKIADYLETIKTATTFRNIKLAGVLVIGDADKSNADCFVTLKKALKDADFPCPSEAYTVENFGTGEGAIRIGTYIIPGKGKNGTLEHLLLESIDDRKKSCIDNFLNCVGIPTDLSDNELAKMKMSSLAGACCRKNPWTSVAYMWSDNCNPVAVDNKCFNELSDFLKDFTAIPAVAAPAAHQSLPTPAQEI
jgi:hypothetical protein